MLERDRMHPREFTMLEDSPSTSLYQRYAPRVFAYIRKHKVSREDAEDILLDVFLAALQHANFSVLGEHEQLAWLQRVAHNKVIDLYRLSTRYPQVPLEHVAEPIDEQKDTTPERA